jgi:hypothetical protein
MRMTKKHFGYLLSGLLFWGFLLGFVFKSIFWPDISIKKSFVICTISTVYFTLYWQSACRGFDFEKPIHWFFLPIASWILFLIWVGVESIFIGEPGYLLEFFR